MRKVLTVAEIEAARERGDKITFETEKRDVTVEGMSALVEQFKRIADANQAMAEKRNDDLVKAISELTKAAGKKEEIGPLIESLKALITKEEPVPYVHEIERDRVRGTITSIKSTPVKGELH